MAKKKNKAIDWGYNLSEYWKILKKHKQLFFGLIFIAILVDGLLLLDKYLFKIVIDNGSDFLAEKIVREVFLKVLVMVGIIFISIVVLRTILQWMKIHIMNRLDAQLIFDIKEKYFNHIMGLSHTFHSSHKTGSLISRMIRGAGAIEGMTDVLIFHFTPLVSGLIVVVVSIALFNIQSVIVIVLTAIFFILYSFFIQHVQQKYKLYYNNSEDLEKGFVSDVFMNIDSIKYFGKEKIIGKKYENISKETKEASIKYWDFFRWFDSVQFFILGIGTFFILYFPLMGFLDKNITLGTLVFIYTVYGHIVNNLFGFVWGMRGFYRSMADFQDLFEYGKINNDIKDGSNAKKLKIQKGTIEFKNIEFKHTKKSFFKNFNLKIKNNEKVALVGHSGCGKTTLIKLLYRLYDVSEGAVLIDGKNIKDFTQESLRENMSIVPQECILFDDTIFNNVKFANQKASKREIWDAIKFAQLHKIIKDFPMGENTIVGERGVKLSGGEKQRVSIARAILANRKILVLDEATSALDSETESEIQKDLEKLLRGRTSIIIAHRLSTIMNADRIIVMKKGKIVQEGKHVNLIREDGEYKKLWNLQKGGYSK